MSGPQVSWLADRRRLHLNHGPIDLIVEAFAGASEEGRALEAAVGRFRTILDELVLELAELRRPVPAAPRPFFSPVAMRMERAVQRFHPAFVTPMAAVAGAVADEVLGAMTASARLEKAYVNNGGDIAIHLEGAASVSAAIAGNGRGLSDRVTIGAADPVRGIATSGWRGRSFSLGIADAVTVLASDAASADAAATMIANEVDLPGHPAVRRIAACELAPDSDLGDRPVTVEVTALSKAEAAEALGRGACLAQACRESGLIHAAALFLAGEAVFAGPALPVRPSPASLPGTSLAAMSP